MFSRSKRLAQLLAMSRFTKRSAAKGLGVSESALRKWLSGSRPIPPDLEHQLAGVLREHAARLETLARQLEGAR